MLILMTPLEIENTEIQQTKSSTVIIFPQISKETTELEEIMHRRK